ncbi:hypothetical protein, partial [Amycolatopsis sp. NPDC058986]|uniref:hypothetical protein n=1 Tax=Amycolatopsis sp. NPDC058986 TaxID=3346685 RepID=UPI003672F6B1
MLLGNAGEGVPRDAFGALTAPRDALVAPNATRASLGIRPLRTATGIAERRERSVRHMPKKAVKATLR